MSECPRDQLCSTVAPLTSAERKWLRSLERVLKDMPERVVLVECADMLTLVDRAAARDVDLHDGGARENGVVLADIENGAFKVQGVSG